MVLFFLMLLANSLGSVVWAQAPARAAVTGRVAQNHRSAADLVINFDLVRDGKHAATYSSRTNRDGKYRLADLPSGDYEVSVGVGEGAVSVGILSLRPGSELKKDFDVDDPLANLIGISTVAAGGALR